MIIDNGGGLAEARKQLYGFGQEIAHLANEAFDRERLASRAVLELCQSTIAQSFFTKGPLRDAAVQRGIAGTEFFAYSEAVGRLIGRDVF